MPALPPRSPLLVIGLFLASVQPAIAQPIVMSDVKHGVSPPLRDLRRGLDERPEFEEEMPPNLPPPTPNEPQQDPAEQTIQGTPLPLTVGQAFDGLGDGVYGFTVRAYPPDATGAVGATQFVQWINSSYAVFDKNTGDLLAGPTLGNRLWQGFGGGCEAHNSGDPVVVYDKLADRWVLSQLVSAAPYLYCIAVSTSNDATDTFFLYAFSMPTLPDYGKLGVWPDAYYMGFNVSSAGNAACAFDRGAMLQGLDARQVCFRSSQGFMLPSDLDGLTPPPDGSPNFFMRLSGNTNLILNRFHVDFDNPDQSTFTGPITIPVDPFTRMQSRVPQPDTTVSLDTLSTWLMFRLAYRNFGDHESLVLNHSVQGSEGGGGVRWYEIQDPNGDPVVYQQGSFVPDSNFRWMGSIAMDQSGNIALGYSLSSTQVYPSVAITGRQPGDDLGTMGAEIILVDGTGSQTNLNRWGDYSTMSVDPVDDCTFWYTAEYHKTTGRPWSTLIAAFKFDTCGQ